MADLARRMGKTILRTAQNVGAGLVARSSAMRLRLTGRKPVHLLLISDGLNYTSEEQWAPFRRHAPVLRQTLGIIVRFLTVEQARRLSARRLAGADMIGLKFSFRADRAASLELTRHIRAAIAGTAARLLYFDGDDDSHVFWPELVEICDLYIKKHRFRDDREYGVTRIGKSNLTDHAARTHGWSFSGNEIAHNHPLDPALAGAIRIGWNIGLDDKIADLAQRMPQPPPGPRPVDVCSRAFVAPDNWLSALRNVVAERLDGMAGTMNVLVPRNRVSQEDYYREMLSSKICVSPFGYGEICWRDFEAILCGCLLVKPDMSHIATVPDIFVPGVTYVPVKWDYSDLAEVCAHYLAHDEERRRIVEQAHRTVMQSLTSQWFVDRLRTTLAP